MTKTALITGASRGIGAGIATVFAAAGYDLYLTCHTSQDKLSLLKQQLESDYSISCHTFQGDIGNEKDVSSIYKEISHLDVLINNAGISHIGLLSDMSLSKWNEVLTTNLTSAFLCCRLAVPLMLHEKRGKIINISSIWGNAGASMEVAYSASKAGLNGFTKALAKELAPSNIQVNAIACGVMDTQMNHCFAPEEMQALIEEIPACRLGTPMEAGKLALQLATGNEYVTGQIIGLDGGFF